MINGRLTANRYHLRMLEHDHKNLQLRAGKNAGIWLALAAALGIHVIILLVPVSRQLPLSESSHELIELQLTTVDQQAPEEPVTIEESDRVATVPEPRKVAEEDVSPVVHQPEAVPEEDPPVLPPKAQFADSTNEPDSTEQATNSQLTNAILSRQFITEKTITEELFPDTLAKENVGFQAEYNNPERQSMIAMLNQPMPELPWAYEPGLIHFAYDPGIKGDLQRFWDVITPEIAFRTKYGTEVRCIWVLVIGGCAWK
jgi:hypothetical protein